MSKTTKFTYEGSNKFCKSIYLIGTIIAEFGMWVWYISVFYGIYYVVTTPSSILQNTNIIGYMVFVLGFIIITQIVGTFIISISQFINWWDRGSVNTKITRNVRK